MSYYMGQVMSIFGRPTDFLSHVLVSDTFERPGLNFYYPHQEETLQIINRDKTFSHFDGSAHDSDILNLSEFPVLPVSSQANLSRFLHSGLRFNQILDAARDELNAVVKPIEYSYGTSNIDVSFGYDPRPFANITLKLYLIRKSGESGTDVYRSFTRVYVVFCNWDKPNNWG